ncbi:MAG: sigma 54-interacting transcriptional regulator, partial [Acidobacteria bacterium]|nr:sigma 54-interacting transcriptional regulator [Acidobacteriota bacterium]
IGLIGQARGGSLLLDEIGEMPVELQPKLLRVLQERVYYRLGSEKALEADFRLISSTNRDPLLAIRDGHLREDLYYRINTIEVNVPPLRERAEDIQHLAEYFLKIYAEKYHRQVISISQHVYQRMFDYPWPGNVRELQNVIERAVLLSKGESIEENILPSAISVPMEVTNISSLVKSKDEVNLQADMNSSVNLQEMTMERMAWNIVSKIPDARGSRQRADILKQFEGAIVNAALERTRGNKQAAANLLGLYRPRLYTLLRKHNLGKTIREIERNISEPTPEIEEMETTAIDDSTEPSPVEVSSYVDNALSSNVRSARN